MKAGTENNEMRVTQNVMACGLALTVSMVFMQIYLYPDIYQYVRANIVQSNIIPYAGMAAAFICSYIAFRWILYKIRGPVGRIPSWVLVFLSWGAAALNAVLLVISYMREERLFDAPDKGILSYHMNEGITFIGMAGIFFMSAVIVERMGVISERRKQKVFFYAFALLTGLIYCHTIFTPNSFLSDYNVHHSNAYINSVYNTMYGEARSGLNSSVYGYYSLLMAPVVKLLGGSITAFYYTICIFALIAHMCMAYAVFSLISTDIVKCAALIAMLLVPCSMQQGVYRQLIPHRIIFPCILTAWLVFCSRRKRPLWVWHLLGYVICAAAMVWNFETGIVCLISWISYFIIETLKEYSLAQAGFYIALLKYAGYAVLTCSGTLVFVNFVNLVMGGGPIGIRTFIFPMMNEAYFDFLITDYVKGPAAWLFVAAMAFVLIGGGLGATRLMPSAANNETGGKKSSVLFAIGVIAVGQMTYYINRAAYGNLYIVFFTAVLMLGILADRCIVNYANRIYKTPFLKSLFCGFSYLLLTVLILIGTGAVYNFSNMENYRKNKEYWDMSKVQEIEEELSGYCEPDTKALGMVIPALYSDLHWDSGYHLIDVADYGVYPKVYEYLERELNNDINEPILIEAATMEKIQKSISLEGFLSRYRAEKTFTFYENELVYWVPKNI